MDEEKDEKKQAQPAIYFNGQVLPTFEAWSKLEVADRASRQLDKLNKRFPHLASQATLEAVETTRKRLKEIEVIMPPAPEKSPELQQRVLEMLRTASLEDVLEQLRDGEGREMDMAGLAYLIGMQRYCELLGDEVKVFQANALSSEQIAALWNEGKRPVPGGQPQWSAAVVERLLRELGR